MGETQLEPASAVPRLSLWQRLKNSSLKKVLLVCAALGVGLGVAVVGIALSVAWYQSRSIEATDWKRLDISSLSLIASLKTDWSDGLTRYQFEVKPRSQDLIPAFNKVVQSNRDNISFTLHLYDKNGFELCKADVRPAPVIDSEGRISAMEANDTFLYCDRSAYESVEHWNLSYVFPKFPTEVQSGENTDVRKREVASQKKSSGQTLSDQDHSGDDTLTGFDLLSGHLETLSGKTFFVYREGEKTTALAWQTEQEVGQGQLQVHFNCKTASDCLIENPQKHQTIHAKLLR